MPAGNIAIAIGKDYHFFTIVIDPANGGKIIILSTRMDSADQHGSIIFFHYYRIGWWSLCLLSPPLLWIRLTCRILFFLLMNIASAGDDNYLLFSIKIDPADQWGFIIFLHYCRIGWWSLLIIIYPLLWIRPTCRFLLFLLIDVWSAGVDNSQSG